MVGTTKKKDQSPSAVPEVVITGQESEDADNQTTYSRELSRDRSSRSVSISRLKIGDPLRKEMMFVREKSPFEIGQDRDIQLASSKAIIDKALVMDVSGGITKIDEFVSLFFTDECVLDGAACKDISTKEEIEVVVIEEEDAPEIVIQPMDLEEAIPEESTADVAEAEEIDVRKQKLGEQMTEPETPQQEKESAPVETSAENVTTEQAESTGLPSDSVVPPVGEGQPESEIAVETQDKIEGDTDAVIEQVIEEISKLQAEEKPIESEEEEESEEETSGDEEPCKQVIDPALWRTYNSDNDDESAWFYKHPEEKSPEPTERQKDAEFKKERLSKRCPVFLTKLTDRAVPMGSEIKLQCSVEGFELSCKWMKDENVVERGKKITTFAVDGLYTLVIKKAKKSDEGIYTIVAKTRGGEITSSANVTVYEDCRDKVELPTMIKIRDYFHFGLNDLIIECQIMSKPSWVIPDVMWLKGEDPITLDNRIRASYEGNEIFQLSIYSPTPEDSGIYTCLAKNSAGVSSIQHEVEYTEKLLYAHVPLMRHADKKLLTEEELLEKQKQEAKQAEERAAARATAKQESAPEPYVEESYIIRDSKNKLTWAGQLNNITAQKGQTVKMICSVKGEQAVFKWLRNEKAIDYSDRIKLMNSGVIGQIVINDVQLKDAGTYVCSAKNNYNEIDTTCVLKVFELSTDKTLPPIFTKAIKEYYDNRTCDLVLETQVSGDPVPEIQWYKNDEKIVYNDKLMLNREPNGRYLLRIHKPQVEDCGFYECRAKNSHGETKVKHEVSFNSNEQFVHARRVEHVDRFKRQQDDEPAVSSPPQAVQTEQQETKATAKVVAEPEQVVVQPVVVDTAEIAEEKTTDQATQETPAEKEKPVDAPKPKPKPKAMPRQRYDGPSEPFIIRDSKKKLTWETKLKNVVVQEGNETKIMCIAAGPMPQFKWTKNGKPLTFTKDVINASKNETGCVKIPKASLADSGEYTVVANNPDSVIECSCTITVYPSSNFEASSAPMFSRVSDYYDIRTNDLILEVHVRGTPTPSLTWERDGREFRNGMDRVIIAREKDGVYKLSIHDPGKLDGGHWVITAVNDVGEEKLKHHVIFKGKEHYQHVAGIYHADPKLVRDGNDEIILPGRSRTTSRAASILAAKTQPREATMPITEDALKAALSEKPIQVELDHEKVHEEEKHAKKSSKHEREWRQKLNTLYSMDRTPFKEEPLKHKKIEATQKLSFDAQLKNMTVQEGNLVKLICSCGGPSPTLKWFKNNTPLTFTNKVKNETKLGVGAITIASAEVSDSGTYKCVANNSFGEVETSCLLTVFSTPSSQYEPPTFVRGVREYYNGQVNDLVLEVQVRGNPVPTVKWFRDGIQLEDLEGDKLFILREPDGIHKLTIHDPQRKDEGRFICEASNVAGKESIKHTVRNLNKEDYTHVYGIAYHDPNVMKHGHYEEEVVEVVEREHKEVVFLEDGSYYMRGQTPEQFWEWETDTTAESEYEPYVPGEDPEELEKTEETVETTKEEGAEESEGGGDTASITSKSAIKEQEEADDAEDEEEDEDEDEDEEKEEVPVPVVVKRGKKIKKMRKKVTRRPQQPDTEKQMPQEEKKLSEIPKAPKQEDTKILQASDAEKDTLRKERYLKLFPEFVQGISKADELRNALRFATEFRDVQVLEGKPAKLFFTVLGPKPDIKWYKNGEPMEFTKTIKNLSGDGSGIVAFSSVAPEDEGTYTAVVKNKFCSITAEAKLSILYKPKPVKGNPPMFLTGIEEKYDFRVDDLMLETTIKSDGLARVQWFMDGIEIPNNEKYLQIREPRGVHKLCIHNPQIRDSGRYMIQATNDHGSTELRYHLKYEGKKDKPSYGIFHADPRKQYEDDDEKPEPRKHREVVFFEDGSYYVRGMTPEQYWEWETDTSAESEYEEYVSEDEPDKEASEDQPESEIKEGGAEQEEEEEDDPWAVKEPKEDEENADDEGAEQEIEEKPPTVVKRGPKIKKMRKKITKPTVEEETPVVRPKAPVRQREKVGPDGKPMLRLSQMISSGQPLEPPGAPKPKRRPIEVGFITRLKNQTVLKGNIVSLNCCCSDNQKIEVTWYKNGEKFEMNRRCVSDVHFGFVTLEIYRADVDDSGDYECHVKTKNGEARDSCKITVFELPDKREVQLVPPTLLCPITETYHPTTNDLYLETRIRANPAPKISWVYDTVFPLKTDHKYEIFNQHYYELGTRITNVALIINDPQLRDSGKYTVTIENEVDKLVITRPVKIDLRPEAHKKKRMDDIVIENEAPRVIPKPPTPEPEIVPEELQPEPEAVAEETPEAPKEGGDAEEEEEDEWAV